MKTDLVIEKRYADYVRREASVIRKKMIFIPSDPDYVPVQKKIGFKAA